MLFKQFTYAGDTFGLLDYDQLSPSSSLMFNKKFSKRKKEAVAVSLSDMLSCVLVAASSRIVVQLQYIQARKMLWHKDFVKNRRL